jgi:hypothetical protein
VTQPGLTSTTTGPRTSLHLVDRIDETVPLGTDLDPLAVSGAPPPIERAAG